MRLMFYKNLVIIIELNNVVTFIKCSTGDVIVIFEDKTEMTIEREKFDFFGGDR